MGFLMLGILSVAWDVQSLMEHAFYPVLLVVLVTASLGVPIPEDVPLIGAGVILAHHSTAASWPGTLSTALLGIMCGDMILYSLGKRWGPEVCQHRWVRWLITPARLERMTAKFKRYGMRMCFFGRFFVGVRAAMCITAGATHFPFWRFVLADLSGALLSIPLFVALGYWFGTAVPELRAYIHLVQWGLLVLAGLVLAGFVALRSLRPHRRQLSEAEPQPRVTAQQSADVPEAPSVRAAVPRVMQSEAKKRS
jgi:membrane protein DedA with SNARE-associated domain